MVSLYTLQKNWKSVNMFMMSVCVCVCVCVVAIIHVRNALCCVGWVHVCSYDTGVSCFNGTSYPGFIFSFHGRESG